ncbi:putative starch synthase 4 [Quercus suber]|uniref:starch synthase n=1 Tax=Quercus suber TaxID=58331 RepID=A0AAW0K523_QUESU
MEIRQSSNGELEVKRNNIGQLFREAQQNILYLNKQRLVAVEELNKANREKQLLLDRIERLEVEKQAGVGEVEELDKANREKQLLVDRIERLEAEKQAGVGKDILYLNKQRLVAVEELNKANREKQLLLDRIERLEVEKQAGVGEVEELDKANREKQLLVDRIERLEAEKQAGVGKGVLKLWGSQGNLLVVSSLVGPPFAFVIRRKWKLDEILETKAKDREKVYGYSDDFERFTYFSRASLDYIVKSGKQPDVLHIHNWETAIVGPLFWDIYVNQCLEQPDKLSLCGLDPPRLHRPDRLQDNTKTHLVNILKGGIVYSNKVVIVSSMNSKGRIISSFSHELKPTLSIHQDKLVIAPYGFDKSTWDPSKDNFLPKNYSAEDMKGKTVCKVALQQHLALSGSASSILVGCFFAELSEIDMENLKAVVQNATRRGVQVILVEISKNSITNKKLESFQELLEDQNVRFINRLGEAISHLVFAGSDIILCQSFHEPDVQVPLKALKYGAAPIAVTSTDDISRNFVDYDYERTKFSQFISSNFGKMSLSQALDEIENNPSRWNRKILAAMAMDFSWDAECCDENNPSRWNRKILAAMAMDFSWDAECCDVHVSAYTAIKKL